MDWHRSDQWSAILARCDTREDDAFCHGRDMSFSPPRTLLVQLTRGFDAWVGNQTSVVLPGGRFVRRVRRKSGDCGGDHAQMGPANPEPGEDAGQA